MASRQDFWEFFDDFDGNGSSISTSALYGSKWSVADTSSAGTPLYKMGVDSGTGNEAFGVATLEFDSQVEAQNLCLYWTDILQCDINDRLIFETRLKMGQASMDSASMFAFGLCGDRNDTNDSIAYQMSFRLTAASTTAVVVESDDGVTDKDDVATGLTLINAYKYFKIDASDVTNVKYYMTDGNSKLVRVAAGTTFDMSGYTGCLQPFFQLQKTSDSNVDKVLIDYCRITGRRVN